jgi:hypothetical protein
MQKSKQKKTGEKNLFLFPVSVFHNWTCSVFFCFKTEKKQKQKKTEWPKKPVSVSVNRKKTGLLTEQVRSLPTIRVG